MVDWTRLKIPKQETIVRQYYTEGHTELTYITTKTFNIDKFTIYRVNKDNTIIKIKSEDSPTTLEKYMEK